MIPYTRYDLNTGENKGGGFAPTFSAAYAQAMSDEGVIFESTNDLQHYVDVDLQIKRDKHSLSLEPDKSSIIADGIDIATITSIPSNVKITWPDGVVEAVTDDIVEFSATQPGSYDLVFSSEKHLERVVRIEASI